MKSNPHVVKMSYTARRVHLRILILNMRMIDVVNKNSLVDTLTQEEKQTLYDTRGNAELREEIITKVLDRELAQGQLVPDRELNVPEAIKKMLNIVPEGKFGGKGFKNLGEIVAMSPYDLLQMRATSIEDINLLREFLADFGLSLRDDTQCARCKMYLEANALERFRVLNELCSRCFDLVVRDPDSRSGLLVLLDHYMEKTAPKPSVFDKKER